MKMTKAQLEEKIGHMAHGIDKLRREVASLKTENEDLKYRHKLAREGRRFWRSEAKKHGTRYNYHSEALREEGRFVKVYTR
jgi:FtsZ-binding cell division protein ZapB